jgi:peptidoglycan/xylan/chitin deacetylase (PgdA/CDA1 family)
MFLSPSIEAPPRGRARRIWGAGGRVGSLGRSVAKAVSRAVLPSSVFVWRGSIDDSRVALTFDDGPTQLTEAYLSVLEEAGARATFFVLGEQCSRYPGIVADIARRGHEVANHGYSHVTFPRLERAGLLEAELERTAKFLPAAGRRRMVRPPHGEVSLSSLVACAQAGFTTVLWSHDSDDCRTESADDVVRGVIGADTRGGSIVLLHEGQTWTLDALPRILHGLKEAGHELVTVGELLAR